MEWIIALLARVDLAIIFFTGLLIMLILALWGLLKRQKYTMSKEADRLQSLHRLPASRVVHDVARDSNLDLILRGTNGAVNKLADAIGGGLRAIALALSTPQDNSAQVQAEVDKITAQLNAGTKEVQDAINEHNKGD